MDTLNSINNLHIEHSSQVSRYTIHSSFIATTSDVRRYNQQVFHHSNKVNSFSLLDDDAYCLDLKRLMVTHA